MISLIESDTFKKEYSKYREDIKHIATDSIRKSAETMLMKLVNEIKSLDQQQHELFSTHTVPARLIESKKKINNLRKDLNKLLKNNGLA